MAKKHFHHPFQPYDIQQDFMEAVWNCIEDGKVGIFESPTGTGKSLSLICGSLTWLREHKRKKFDEQCAQIQIDGDEPDWIVEQAREARRRELREMRADLEAHLSAVREREKKIRGRAEVVHVPKRHKVAAEAVHTADSDDQFVLDDYESDDADQAASKMDSVYSTATLQLMNRLNMLPSRTAKSREILLEEEPKIFFCSRTHSQLSQFIGELQRVKLPPGMPPEISNQTNGDQHSQIESLKHITLGSRKNLCINPKVSKLPSQTAINERCIELQQSKLSGERCPYICTRDNEDVVLDFRDHALARIRDIEDMATLGTKLQICPYYASRTVIAPAEIVTLPYPLLLQKSARDALGISLKGHVIIIDEAHNLMSAIEGIHSAQVTDVQLGRSREALMAYLQKFRNRLKGKNRVYVAQLVRVIDSLLSCASTLRDQTAEAGVTSAEAMLAGKSVDQINLTKLVRYIDDSKLARKVDGYIAYTKSVESVKQRSKAEQRDDVPALMHVQTFLTALMNPSKEGRFFWSHSNNSISLRYLLLDPSEHFRDVVEGARAVILAGGTMSPMRNYQLELFPYLHDIRTLSCGHLIPQSSLLVRTIASDDSGMLEFSYKSRSSDTGSYRIGNALLKLSPHVQGGFVVFFPSYAFLEQTVDGWRQRHVLQQLETVSTVHIDSRKGNAEDTFRAYSESIISGPGKAVLLSVIGGKLSEGINFSDNLGRCVLVVGLPFPNLETPEWKAKMQYIEAKAVSRGEVRGHASRMHAENVCMRSVNQAVGRVIRHKGDWASILLMDTRYTEDRVRGKLPAWICDCLPSGSALQIDAVADELRSFFASRTAPRS